MTISYEHRHASPIANGDHDFFIECRPFPTRVKAGLVGDRLLHFLLNSNDVDKAPKRGARHAIIVHFNEQKRHTFEATLDRVQCENQGWDITARFPDDTTYDDFWRALREWRRQQQNGLHATPTDTIALPGKDLDTSAAKTARVKFLTEKTGSSLDTVADAHIDPEMLRNNIESLIGEVAVPVGVVGPLLLRRSTGTEEVYVPFATTEDALVASATRGVTAISRSGGAYAQALQQRVARVPSFKLTCVSDALFFIEWVIAHLEPIRAQISQVSKHAVLTGIEPECFGRHVHLHFVYQTGDAAGQNMVTACTWHACKWILATLSQRHGISVEDFYAEAGLANDKRLTPRAFTQGRGVRVTAEAMLSSDVIRKVLKIEPTRLLDSYGYWTTAHQAAGNIGGGLHLANAIAAIFTATGQDIASVHESSVGVFYLEKGDGDDVYASLTLPNLLIGTVGGGTGLPYQQQCLALMGCAGSHKVARLAEIIATATMGLELSLLSALAAGHFAEAHERMGRNRPTETAPSRQSEVPSR